MAPNASFPRSEIGYAAEFLSGECNALFRGAKGDSQSGTRLRGRLSVFEKGRRGSRRGELELGDRRRPPVMLRRTPTCGRLGWAEASPFRGLLAVGHS